MATYNNKTLINEKNSNVRNVSVFASFNDNMIETFIDNDLVSIMDFPEIWKFTREEILSSVEDNDLHQLLDMFLHNNWDKVIDCDRSVKIYEKELEITKKDNDIFIDGFNITHVIKTVSFSNNYYHDKDPKFQKYLSEIRFDDCNPRNLLQIYAQYTPEDNFVKVRFLIDGVRIFTLSLWSRDDTCFIQKMLETNIVKCRDEVKNEEHSFSLFPRHIVLHKLVDLVFDNITEETLIHENKYEIDISTENNEYRVDIDSVPLFIYKGCDVTDKKIEIKNRTGNFYTFAVLYSGSATSDVVVQIEDDKSPEYSHFIEMRDNLLERIVQRHEDNLSDSEEVKFPEQVEFSNEDILNTDILNEGYDSKSLVSVYAKKIKIDEDCKIELRMMNNDTLLAKFEVYVCQGYFEDLDGLKGSISSSGEFCQNGLGGGDFDFELNTDNIKHIAHPNYPFDEEKLIYQKRHSVDFEFENEIEENEDEMYNINNEIVSIKLDGDSLTGMWMQKLDINQRYGKLGSSFYLGGGCATDCNGYIGFDIDNENIVININDSDDIDYPGVEITGYIPIEVYHDNLRYEMRDIRNNKKNKIVITKAKCEGKKYTFSILCDNIPLAYVTVPKKYKKDIRYKDNNYFFNLFIGSVLEKEISSFFEYSIVYEDDFDVTFENNSICLNGKVLFSFTDNSTFTETPRYKQFNIESDNLSIEVLYPTM